MSAGSRRLAGAVALAAAIIGGAAAPLAMAPRAQAGERMTADKHFEVTVRSVARDADGNILSVTAGSTTAAWREWLAASQGANVWLSRSLGVHFPNDSGTVASTSGDDATIDLSVPGRLSFGLEAGQTFTVWAE
jgi:hypothetical protein